MNAMIHNNTLSGIVLKALSNWSNVGMSSYFVESLNRMKNIMNKHNKENSRFNRLAWLKNPRQYL